MYAYSCTTMCVAVRRVSKEYAAVLHRGEGQHTIIIENTIVVLI